MNSSGWFHALAREKKKKKIFFSLRWRGWRWIFSGGWSPHMDYPDDSVIALASTLVGLFHAKNGIWFRLFLAEIFFVEWRQKKKWCYFAVSRMWWDEYGCSLHVIQIGEFGCPDLSWHDVAPVMWPSQKRRCLFLLTVRVLAIIGKIFVFAFVLDNKFACFAMQPVCTYQCK